MAAAKGEIFLIMAFFVEVMGYRFDVVKFDTSSVKLETFPFIRETLLEGITAVNKIIERLNENKPPRCCGCAQRSVERREYQR